MSEFTIILPVYNEEENLLRVEKELLNYKAVASLSTFVLFVNDGSSDDSGQLIKEICLRNKDFHYISFKKNQGLSAALKAGFDWVQTPLLGYMDSDLQTSPQDFNLLLEHIGEYDLVNGIRSQRKDDYLKRVSSRIGNNIRRVFTNDGIVDTGCPLKIIKTDFAKRIPMFNGLHRFLPAMILLQGGKVYQVPIRHFPRTDGKKKYGLRNRLFGPLSDCFAYLWMRKNYISYEIKEKSRDDLNSKTHN